MAFYGYKGDADNCYSTPYSNTYDYDFAPTSIQDSSSQYYDSGEPEIIQYNSSAYYRDDSFVNPSGFNYSVYSFSEPRILQYEPPEHYSCNNYYEYSVNPSEINYSEPKLLQYEPTPSHTGYFRSETKFTISYSTVEFNEPEFEEYDPTPYGGGYDATITYGKPLPPSDAICYPRSIPKTDSVSLENFSYSSIPSPYGKDDDLPKKPPNGSKPVDTKTETETHVENTETETHVENGDKVSSDGTDDEILEPSDMIPRDDSPSYEHQNGFENGTRGGYGYESEKQGHQIPYGSGLEAIDLCESIFGYWPCLAKIEQQQQRSKCCQQERRIDPWKGAADYLFGSPGVYDYENYHHQQQAQYECYENSWLQ